MIPITRKIAKEERYFEVYTREEADEKGIEYVYWNEAKPGDWALTDDDHVAECFGVRPAPKGAEQVLFSFGAPWRKTKRVEALKFIEARAFSQARPISWDEREGRNARAKRVIKAAAAQIVETGKTDDHVLAELFRPNAKNRVRVVRSWLKSKKAQEMIMIELQTILERHGITPDFALKKLKKWIEMAEKSERPSDMKDVFLELKDLTGMAKKSTQTDEFGFDYTQQIGEKQEKGRITARRTKQLPEYTPFRKDQPPG